MAGTKTIELTPPYKRLHEQFKREMLVNVDGLARTSNLEYLRQIYPLLSSMRIALGAITSLDEFTTLRTEFDEAMSKVWENLTKLQDKEDGYDDGKT